jgi:uncharacterized membrane protein
VSKTYETHLASFESGLESVQKWKKAKKVCEYGGLVVVLGAYFLKIDFWGFLVVVLAVLGVYLLLWNKERASFAAMKRELADLTETGEFNQFDPAQQQELTRLCEKAAKEVK